MQKVLLALLSIAICTSGISQETRDARRARMGTSAGYATRDATVLSMVGWGFGIAVGIAAISALIDNSEEGSSSSSSSSTSH
jgi:hypothetical protein